ncbi:hypothetical protein QCA50_007946 [Cerrena zonata]|uniref:Protein kinase domain-containing protein n=1 Tax=Cerrena zonata TaxID=2478898 RepID=A0AAW0GDM6_9APHY
MSNTYNPVLVLVFEKSPQGFTFRGRELSYRDNDDIARTASSFASAIVHGYDMYKMPKAHPLLQYEPEDAIDEIIESPVKWPWEHITLPPSKISMVTRSDPCILLVYTKKRFIIVSENGVRDSIEIAVAESTNIYSILKLLFGAGIPSKGASLYIVERLEYGGVERTPDEWLEFAQNLDITVDRRTVFLGSPLPDVSLALPKLYAPTSTRTSARSSAALASVPEDETLPQFWRSAILDNARKANTEGKLSEMRVTQVGQNAIHNFRPFEMGAPPIGIYHHVFARFAQIMNEDPTKTETAFSPQELNNARAFITTSLDYYDTEAQRQVNISGIGKVLGDSILESFRVIRDPTHDFFMDGSVRVPCPMILRTEKAVAFILELKPDLCSSESDALDQAQQYYRVLLGTPEYANIVESCCCPVILIGLSGAHMVVAGAVFTEYIVCQRLTDYIFLGPKAEVTDEGVARTDDYIYRVALLFRALSEAHKILEDFYSHLEVPSPKPSLTRHKKASKPVLPGEITIFPHFQSFVDESTGKRYTIQYLQRLTGPSLRAVFRATLRSEDNTLIDVVVKFTSRYGLAAHKVLAENQPPLAPKLYFAKVVPLTASFVVVMDHVGEMDLHRRRNRLTWGQTKKLKDAVSLLHLEDYVLGDLRACNVRVGPGLDDLYLIDFDWSGKEGDVQYPANINLDQDIGWAVGVQRGAGIEKKHDTEMLEKLLRTHSSRHI